VGAQQVLSSVPPLEELQQELDMQNPTNAQVVVLSETRRRNAVQDSNLAMIVGGIGLAALGAAWFGYDLTRRSTSAPAT
jgi:hypothetical protein